MQSDEGSALFSREVRKMEKTWNVFKKGSMLIEKHLKIKK
jgi:hypothetical protein